MRAVLLLLSTLVRLAVGLALGVVLATVLVPPALAVAQGQLGVSSLVTPLGSILGTADPQAPQPAGASLRDRLAMLTQLASATDVALDSASRAG